MEVEPPVTKIVEFLPCFDPFPLENNCLLIDLNNNDTYDLLHLNPIGTEKLSHFTIALSPRATR